MGMVVGLVVEFQFIVGHAVTSYFRYPGTLICSGALNLQVMEFGSKGGGICKYWNMQVKTTGWKLKVMHFVGLEFASSGN